jgi:hypothetical protein
VTGIGLNGNNVAGIQFQVISIPEIIFSGIFEPNFYQISRIGNVDDIIQPIINVELRASTTVAVATTSIHQIQFIHIKS